MKFNIFKKRSTADESKTESKEKKEKELAGEEVKHTPELKGSDFSYQQIISPYLTEKTSILNNDRQYAFKVFPRANKVEIKKAVEQLYGVHVEKVRMAVMPSKKRRLGKFEGEKGGFKKALVRLRKGEKIEVAH